ncbi:MAG: AsmA-like C-terminal domain-containing protein, partial [Pseudomonadota bacterium]
MLTALHIAVRTLVWGLVALVLLLVLALVRLDSGPLALDWLQPRIERALSPDRDAVSVTTERVELRLNKDARTLELVGVDVRYRVLSEHDDPAHPFLIFPEVEITLSVEALMKKGMIAASEVVAHAPSLIMTRDEDGIIGLQSEVDYEGQAEDIDLGHFLRRFATATEADGRLAFLQRLQIGGGRVAYYDHRHASAFTAEAADLVLVRRDGGVDGWVQAEIAQPSVDPAKVQIAGRLAPGAERIAFEADIADLMPADLPTLLPEDTADLPINLSGLRLPVQASLRGEVGFDGARTALEVDLETGAGTVDLPDHLAEVVDVARIEVKGTLSADRDSFTIDHAHLASRGAEIGGSGRFVWREDQPAVTLDLEARDLRAEDLPAFWPRHEGKKTRAWIAQHIKAGLVTEAKVTLDLRAADFGDAPLRKEAIDGSFAFEGLSVRYIDEMPPLEQASGRARFDAQQMAFDVDGGSNGGLTLEGGSVTITGIGKPGRLTTQLHVHADAEGTIEQALEVLDHPPLNIAEELAILPADTGGGVSATIDVRMPLHDSVTAEEAVVTAVAALTDISIGRLPKLGGDVGLSAGDFDLEVEEEAVRLSGEAAINGLPLTIDIVEPRDKETAKRRIDLAGSISREQLASLSLPVDGFEGAFGFTATVTETDTHFWVDLEADLASLSLAPPGLIWRKPGGESGTLRASIAIPLEGPIEVKQFDVETGGLQAAGSFVLSSSNDSLASLVLDSVQVAGTDAAMRFTDDGKGGFDVVIEGDAFDLDGLIGEDPEIGSRFDRFHAILRAGRLRARGIELLDVEADAVRTVEGWRSASLIGALASGGKLALELTPDGDDRLLEVRSDDAGAVIEAFDLGQRISGGNLQLSARLKPGETTTANGRFEITEFVLQDAPVLARMLTLASLTGIGNLLEGDGIQVDHLILPFALADRKLSFADGLMRGSQLGLTVKGDVDLDKKALDLAGTIIPVYGLNRLIGQVPIIGRILTGVDGRGAFAATYSIKGPRDNPEVYV